MARIKKKTENRDRRVESRINTMKKNNRVLWGIKGNSKGEGTCREQNRKQRKESRKQDKYDEKKPGCYRGIQEILRVNNIYRVHIGYRNVRQNVR